jgi:DNA modification methylase
VTSPPYWGLRDYSSNGQIGLEATPDEYVNKLVEIFGEVKRVLRRDGTLWLNMGDSYAGGWKGGNDRDKYPGKDDGSYNRRHSPSKQSYEIELAAKNLVGIPWRLAFALQGDGWYLRQDIIWSKPNPMPESVTDRCTKSHEYLFLLTKSARYFYDAEAIKERSGDWHQSIPGREDGPGQDRRQVRSPAGWKTGKGAHGSIHENGREPFVTYGEIGSNRNKRSVWTVATAPYAQAHFATYPPDLIKPCIMAGSRAGDTVLDPFAGSGTTGAVALELGRKAILIELNPKYIKLIEERCDVTLGLALA